MWMAAWMSARQVTATTLPGLRVRVPDQLVKVGRALAAAGGGGEETDEAGEAAEAWGESLPRRPRPHGVERPSAAILFVQSRVPSCRLWAAVEKDGVGRPKHPQYVSLKRHLCSGTPQAVALAGEEEQARAAEARGGERIQQGTRVRGRHVTVAEAVDKQQRPRAGAGGRWGGREGGGAAGTGEGVPTPLPIRGACAGGGGGRSGRVGRSV